MSPLRTDGLTLLPALLVLHGSASPAPSQPLAINLTFSFILFLAASLMFTSSSPSVYVSECECPVSLVCLPGLNPLPQHHHHPLHPGCCCGLMAAHHPCAPSVKAYSCFFCFPYLVCNFYFFFFSNLTMSWRQLFC